MAFSRDGCDQHADQYDHGNDENRPLTEGGEQRCENWQNEQEIDEYEGDPYSPHTTPCRVLPLSVGGDHERKVIDPLPRSSVRMLPWGHLAFGYVCYSGLVRWLS